MCLTKATRIGAVRRTTYTKADANDPKKVYQWLIESEAWLRGEDTVKEKLVFLASDFDDAGKAMADNFLRANHDYAWCYDIFQRSAYNKAFAGAQVNEEALAVAASEAFALWARHPIVFNADKGTCKART